MTTCEVGMEYVRMLRSHISELSAIAQHAEWSGKRETCPACQRTKVAGHSRDCGWDRVLRWRLA